MQIIIKSTEECGLIAALVRKSQGLTQLDLAEMIGASHVYLRDVENGKGTVNFGTVLQLMEELGIQISLDVPDTDIETLYKKLSKRKDASQYQSIANQISNQVISKGLSINGNRDAG